MIDNSTISNHGRVVWLFGRPCAGKTTIGSRLSAFLKGLNYPVITLDGDELRGTINRDLGFSPEDRYENIRRSAEMARVLAKKGIVVVCSFVTPTNKLRNLINEILFDVPNDLIFINTSLEECKRRDTKGHYRQAQTGVISDFTGVGSPFEEPVGEHHILNTKDLNIDEAVEKCFRFIFPGELYSQ